ncbi:MAG: glycosyltransferase [Azoarcus sp.]|jgi:glycosyltransferase involved in cell wall biosynthesis|nr:glycosyltransferase [Azoarcus sp.]
MTSPRVAVLLASRNGERFLPAQLASLAAQSHRDWCLFVSDDGSHDATRAIVAGFAADVGDERVRLYDGPCRGFVANFLSLVCHDDVGAANAGYFAFCDQDDVWHSDKLARALTALAAAPQAGHPARLYGGRTRLIDEQGRETGLSPPFAAPLSFANALVQSYAGANTMVFNAAARELLCRCGSPEGIASHDWWTYLLVSGVGGRLLYDPLPVLDYRQHAANAQGHNRGFAARLARLRDLLAGRMRGWNACHVAALEAHAELLTAPNRVALAHFHRALDGCGPAAARALCASGARRQRAIDNLALFSCALLGRL